MSVYIKGMDMPKRCEDCFCYRHNAEYDYAYCNISSVKVLGNANERLNNCPLVPVPEHGDLIDKSGVDVLSWTEDPEKDFADGVLFVLDKLDELPVIIPADGEDYEVPAGGNLYDSLKRGLEQAINGESRSETIPAEERAG